MKASSSALPRLLVLSHVLPFPGHSGQQQRVANTLRALRGLFHVTFATFASARDETQVRRELALRCDDVVILSSQSGRSIVHRLYHAVRSRIYALATGLKPSNYFIGQLEFAPERVMNFVKSSRFDLALLEYFYAADAAGELRVGGTPCVLDSHNVLWRAYERQLNALKGVPALWKEWALERYRKAEEKAWRQFNGVIAINTEEAGYMQTRLPVEIPVLKACMGLDLKEWPCAWAPATPPRVAYYGGLGSAHNVRDALKCYHEILPNIWRTSPEAEFWVIGSNPPSEIQALANDARVRVTGFVERAQEVLRTISVCLCPWTGTYGFRSRLVEIMACGVPVVASPDAAYGMEFRHGEGILLEPDSERLATSASRLLLELPFARQQSLAARASVEAHYSFAATYGKLADELLNFVRSRVPA